jgi:hypothetical protein
MTAYWRRLLVKQAGWVEPDAMATLLLALADGIALHAALNPEAIDHDAFAVVSSGSICGCCRRSIR